MTPKKRSEAYLAVYAHAVTGAASRTRHGANATQTNV